ncbi:hypothetical protein OPV22_006745 [Ensete ventricosum]|uniref:Uncharacterized protein n=1 Tax=Ensete ventricosum TaxID=4639 RepID=A0AAV8RQB0_ENSVE|nr:hypothetical protein OPV22_006745 [Ensete ventricosum]
MEQEQPKERDTSIRLDIVQLANLGGISNLVASRVSFEPQSESSDPPPASRNSSSKQAPEKKLTLFAFRLALLEKSASGLGKLAFVWATVVLLGGFAITLERKDFVFVTVILVIESTRIFSRSHELEWQHQSASTLGGAGTYSFRALQSNSPLFFRALSAAFNPVSVLRRDSDRSRRPARSNRAVGSSWDDSAVESTAQRAWHAPDVPLLPYAGWVFVSKNISRVLSWLQLLSALACVALSLMRLIQQDYGDVGRESRNRKQALNLFYALALAEALVFLMEKAYWTWRILYCNLLATVSRECELGEGEIVSIRRFFYDAYAKCIDGSVFDGVKMDLVTFAKELLNSEFRDEQLIGAHVLERFVNSAQFADDTLRKIGTSTWVIERLVEMLNWKNPVEEEIRRCAAQIVSKLAGKRQNVLRVAAIPGAMESISSLLHSGKTSNMTPHDMSERSDAADGTNYGFSVFNLLGLLILKKLAADHDNCWKIGNARGLLPKIIDLTSASKTLLRDDRAPDSQIRTVKRSLQVLKRLGSTTGSTGKFLRQEISEIVFTVSNIRGIIQNGESHMVLQKLGIEVLKNLAMDDNAKEKIGSTGGITKLLLSIFLRPGFTEEQNSLSNEAGVTLAVLTLQSLNNCDRVLKEKEVLEQLMGVLTEPVLQINASRILRNLCAYTRDECADRVGRVTAAMPTVLKLIMEAKENLLEVSIGLTTQICKLMEPDEFAEALKQASIEETDLVEKLVKTLEGYTYPEIKVPRIRRFVIEQAIWMMKSNRNSIQLFKKFDMENLLGSVAETTSQLEYFHIFSGSVGLIQHSKPLSSLLETALDLMIDR